LVGFSQDFYMLYTQSNMNACCPIQLAFERFEELIQDFSLNNNISDIEIKRASQKLRFQEERSMSAVTWPNMSLDEAFSFLQENNGWFKWAGGRQLTWYLDRADAYRIRHNSQKYR